MHYRKFVVLIAWSVIALALGACSSDGGSENGVVHVEDPGTPAPQTTARPSATPGPSPTPTVTSTPYSIPTNAPDFDGSTVIARVGSQAITLAQFQKQVRFERWYRLYQLARIVEREGVEQVLDLRRPENASLISLFGTLADSNSFGIQVERIMIIDAIVLDEARRRGLEVNPAQFESRLGQYLSMTVGADGKLPPEFDAAYEEFVRQMKIYTGMSEEEFRRIVRARTLYSQLEFLMGQQPEAVAAQEARIGKNVRDIIVSSEEQAQDVIARLEAGEAMRDIATSLGFIADSEDSERLLRWSDTSAPAAVKEAVFNAAPDSVVGPIPTEQGWYVAVVGDEVFDVPLPSELEEMRKQYYLDWVESRMDDPEYVVEYDNWFDYIPQEPLPRDVSPLFHDENIILPETGSDPFGVEDVPEATPATPAS